MEKLELQILSGLHGGARHLISKKRFTVGGDDDADLRLLDEEFDGARLHFEVLESGAFAVTADAAFTVFEEAGHPARDQDVLAVGGFLKMGEVWIGLCVAGGLLAKVPTIRAAAPERDLDPTKIEGFSFDDALANNTAADDYTLPEHDNERSSRSLRRKAAAGFVGGVIAILVVGLGVAWMPSEAHTSIAVASPQARADLAAAGVSPATGSPGVSATVPQSVHQHSAAVSPAPVALGVVPVGFPKADSNRDGETRRWLDETLQDKGLASLINTRVGAGEITFGGKLDRSELRDFEKLLPDIEARLGKDYRIKAHIEPASTGPTFRIREVVLGKDGWIVTDMGQRVLVGGTIDGYRLMAIEGNKVIFMGASRVEIQI